MYSTSLLLTALLIPVTAFADVTAQTDWSGGGGIPGPVSMWSDQFNDFSTVCTSIEGEVTLGALVDPELVYLPFSCYGGNGANAIWIDMNDDGYTDVICRSNGEDSLYWRENPQSQGLDWPRHHITAEEKIWSFDYRTGTGSYDWIIVAYVDPYYDETQVAAFYELSPDNWYSIHVGELGEADYDCGITVGDLDGNGYTDIVGWKWSFDQVVVWWNGAAGTPQTIIQPHTPGKLQLADLDSDGDCEIFVETSWIPSSRIYWNNGGSFTLQYIGDYYYTSRKAVADLDGDAFSEIAFSFGGSSLHLYRYSPEVAGWIFQDIAEDAYMPLFTDIDDDGQLDLICTQEEQLSYHYNLGQGNAWREGRMYDVVPSWGRTYFADINSDSDTDVVLAWYGAETCWFTPEGFSFAASGHLTSSWLNPEMDLVWEAISFESIEPAGTNVTVQVRTTDNISSPSEWSPELASGTDITGYCSWIDPYFQYKINLYSADPAVSPAVTSVSLDWTTPVEGESQSLQASFQAQINPSSTPVLLVEQPASGIYKLDVFDVAGRVCMSRSQFLPEGEMVEVPLPTLPDGLYHARLELNGSSVFTSFVVIGQ